MAGIELGGVTKRFDQKAVVRDVDLHIQDGEFLALLGPSGCGKTTLLRMIAGLERPTSGEIRIGSDTVASQSIFVPPEDRKLGMVFQSYALWPHMTVFENVAFALRVAKLRGKALEDRVTEVLEAVGLAEFAARKPAQLSGGQRQRTALARCLAMEPRLILLDEPLANLDANLRGTMQREFRRIHRESGTTFVFVTHDQHEAMALSDRVAVMHEGRILQLGTPQDVYGQPANPTVARFVGKGALLPVEVTETLGQGRLRALLSEKLIELSGPEGTGERTLCLRPGDIEIPPADTAGFAATVMSVEYRGGMFALELAPDSLNGTRLEAASPVAYAEGDRVDFGIKSGWVLPG
ncbi:ABC transporter ATP-binding protein [Chelativorans sp. YIM 93263]|uniref:ABC transporter ATP-binding protein n=1 Tax=Chelativorans sp. YIM 93263 TaxID=2906648 RepID=UPI002379DA66|nr:ABC transporter ATP-binding protein [Chelativorans sp. YIM 93263]